MYFLPAFLSHYRRLGVERFVILNDQSDDRSFEYLIKQPDTVIVESARRYSDPVYFPPALSNLSGNRRILSLWRTMLHEMFARDRWALQVDLDEFVRLPEGFKFQDLILRLEIQDRHQVWGVMLDVYPENIAALAKQQGSDYLDTSAAWYFDGEPHLRLRRNRAPKTIHPGARARLYYEYGLANTFPELNEMRPKLLKRIRNFKFKAKIQKYNEVKKPVLLKWQNDCYHISSHHTNQVASDGYLLPIQHFRFSGSIFQKIEMAVREKSYYRGSLDHRLLAELLERMKEQNGSFLYPKSRRIDLFSNFVETRNATGF